MTLISVMVGLVFMVMGGLKSFTPDLTVICPQDIAKHLYEYLLWIQTPNPSNNGLV